MQPDELEYYCSEFLDPAVYYWVEKAFVDHCQALGDLAGLVGVPFIDTPVLRQLYDTVGPSVLIGNPWPFQFGCNWCPRTSAVTITLKYCVEPEDRLEFEAKAF